MQNHPIRFLVVTVGFQASKFEYRLTYMNPSTSSCNSQECQLRFEAKMVPIGLKGSRWPASECIKGTYLDISPVDLLCYNWRFVALPSLAQVAGVYAYAARKAFNWVPQAFLLQAQHVTGSGNGECFLLLRGLERRLLICVCWWISLSSLHRADRNQQIGTTSTVCELVRFTQHPDLTYVNCSFISIFFPSMQKMLRVFKAWKEVYRKMGRAAKRE